MRRVSCIIAAVFSMIFLSMVPAEAAPSYGNTALDWAEGNALGHPYVYGGTGPGFDCSGLVQAAFKHAGIILPRTTFEMLGDPRLHRVPVGAARRGDLLFYGAGHVEFATVWPDTSFGAHDTGTTVGWVRWSGWWAPTMAFEVW